jgi:Anti-sigma-K factor rskA
MPLSPDDQALLELILAKGQSYEDISSLLDVPEEDVRARARAALTELGGADPDRNVALTDWVLGQADPIGRADAARHVREDPEDHRLASELISSLRELAPEADLPRLPGEPGGGRFMRRSASARPEPATAAKPTARDRAAGTGPLASLGERRTKLIVACGAAAVLLIAVVLAVTGAFGGGDEDSTSARADSTGATTADTGREDIQTVQMQPSGGGDAEGTATFGIASGSQAFVDVDISNLEPAPEGQAYVFWLLVSEDQGHPLTPFQVDQDGTYAEQVPIASFLTQLAARTQFVDVSLSARKPLLQEVQAAVEEGTPIIDYTGESIMRGSVEPGGGGGGAQGGGTTTLPEG